MQQESSRFARKLLESCTDTKASKEMNLDMSKSMLAHVAELICCISALSEHVIVVSAFNLSLDKFRQVAFGTLMPLNILH